MTTSTSAGTAGSRATRARRPARCAARRSTSGTASATPAGSSSRRSGTWRGSSSASRTARSPAPSSRSPSSTWRRRRWIYFSHHVLLWADPARRLANMSMRGGWKRMMAGLPLIMMEAHGPGHIALSDNHAGEVIALPLQHGQQIWVREHRFLCATGNIRYDWDPTDVWYVTGQDADDQETHYPMGQYGDIFTAHRAPGPAAAARAGQHVHPRPAAGRVAARPAELAALPRRVGAGAPAPGVPAEHGLRVLAQLVELPQHLGPAERAPAGSRSSRCTSGPRTPRPSQPLATPRTTAGRSAPGPARPAHGVSDGRELSAATSGSVVAR